MLNKLPPLAGPVDASGEPELNIAPIEFWLNEPTKHAKTVFRIVAEQHIAELLAEVKRLRAAAVPSSPAQQDIRLMTDFQIVEVLKSRAAHDANNEFGRWIGRLLTAWVTDSPLTDIDAILAERLPPSSPVADSPTPIKFSDIPIELDPTMPVDEIRFKRGKSAPSPSAGAAQKKRTETKKL